MTTMQIPGFTAESSLYASENLYRGGYLFSSATGGVKMLPQAVMFEVCGPCQPNGMQTCCSSPLGDFHCWIQACSPDPCAHCRSPKECCECNGGIWTGTHCVRE